MARFTAQAECSACNATGLFVGSFERDGFAIQCSKCHGTGCAAIDIKYEPFTARHKRDGVVRVLQSNPGFCVGTRVADQAFPVDHFGGMPAELWERGWTFPPRSEMRAFTCPAWWYQSVDYSKKPDWPECLGCGLFSSCKSFPEKSKCWERWDAEQAAKGGAP